MRHQHAQYGRSLSVQKGLTKSFAGIVLAGAITIKDLFRLMGGRFIGT